MAKNLLFTCPRGSVAREWEVREWVFMSTVVHSEFLGMYWQHYKTKNPHNIRHTRWNWYLKAPAKAHWIFQAHSLLHHWIKVMTLTIILCQWLTLYDWVEKIRNKRSEQNLKKTWVKYEQCIVQYKLKILLKIIYSLFYLDLYGDMTMYG